jgi:riboflavin transporter FmnP
MNLRKLTMGALLVAAGIILPMMFHAVGMGKVFLPMHIPVLLAGFIVGPFMGALVGFITPLLSAVLTGMPPLMPPIAQTMMIELAVYGAATGLLHRNTKLSPAPCLVSAMAAGRIVYGLMGAFILPLFGFEKISVIYPITYGVVGSLPGILIQLAVIPALVYGLEKARLPIYVREERQG